MRPAFVIPLFCALVFILISPGRVYSQEMTRMCNLTPEELNKKFQTLSADTEFKLLASGLKEKGWNRITESAASYGFTGTLRDSASKAEVPVEFYAFDFYNKATGQAGSLIWRSNGKSIYKAYLLFKAGEKNMGKALEEAVEMYAEGGKIQKASSWRTCFRSCASRKCPSFCFQAAIFCAGGVLASPGAGVAIWIACAGISCGLCFAVCALNCS
jgi:hypothetical protein